MAGLPPFELAHQPSITYGICHRSNLADAEPELTQTKRIAPEAELLRHHAARLASRRRRNTASAQTTSYLVFHDLDWVECG